MMVQPDFEKTGGLIPAIAQDAATGDVRWVNDRTGFLYGQHPHAAEALGGLTPQGYLAIVGDKLVVPCGTQLPAFFDLKTGERPLYTMGWGGRNGLPKGSWLPSLR